MHLNYNLQDVQATCKENYYDSKEDECSKNMYKVYKVIKIVTHKEDTFIDYY